MLRSAEAPGSPLAWCWQPLHVPWLHVSLRRHLGGDMCQSHPCLWGAHMALADSSPTQRSLGGVVMKGINASTWKKKYVILLCGRYLRAMLPVTTNQLRFSEIDLPFLGENEVRRWSQLGPVKPQILHSLTQAEAKLPPDLETLV